MTYNEITLFRRFMTNKGVLNTFEYTFQNHGLEKKTIDQYYEDANAEFVIMTAFDFSKVDRTVYNYSFWEKINDKWQFCLKRYRDEGKMENPPELRCAKCGKMLPISAFNLGKNLVPHKNCKECETKLVARKIATSDTTEGIFKICAHCGKKKPIDEFHQKRDSPDGHSNYCKDCIHEANRLRYNPQPNEQTTMEDFTFFDFDKPTGVRERMIQEGQAAINYKKKGSYLTFGQKETSDLFSAQLNHVRIRVDNITGAVHMVFNKDKGAAVTLRSGKNAVIGNQELINFVMDKLKLDKKEGERYMIDIGKNLSNTEDFITYNLIRGK